MAISGAQDMMSVEQQHWALALAYVYLQAQQYDKAIQLVEALLVLDKNDPQALKMLSYAYFKTARYEDTFVLARKWIQQMQKVVSPKEIALMYLLQGRALLKLNRKDLAKKCLEKYKQYLGSANV